MKITRKIVADKITDYLHGKLSQAQLVDWPERAMMDADFDEADMDALSDIVGALASRMLPNSGYAGRTAKNFFAASDIGQK